MCQIIMWIRWFAVATVNRTTWRNFCLALICFCHDSDHTCPLKCFILKMCLSNSAEKIKHTGLTYRLKKNETITKQLRSVSLIKENKSSRLKIRITDITGDEFRFIRPLSAVTKTEWPIYQFACLNTAGGVIAWACTVWLLQELAHLSLLLI